MHKFSTMFQLPLFLTLSLLGMQARTKDVKKDAYRQLASTKAAGDLYKYDKSGNLVINASVSGASQPILLDSKKYYPACTTNVYFTFTLHLVSHTNIAQTVCDQGITICYEGQLVGDHVRAEYLLKNIKTKDAEQWTKVCIAANKNQSTDGVRALNLAVKSVQNLDSKDIKSKDTEFKAKNTLGNGNSPETWHFFVISSTIFEQKYHFIIPKDGIMILHIGERKALGVKITDSRGHPIPSVKFTLNGETFGVTESWEIPPSFDRANGDILSELRGLWMLYLDFKSDYKTWQVISTVHPGDSKENGKMPCPMVLSIRGNRMRPCRSYFEDIAIFDEVNAQVNITYTSVVGIVKTQQHGEEDVTATAKRWKRAQMEVRSHKDTSQLQDSQSTIDMKELQEIKLKMKEKKTMSIYKGEHEWSANTNPGQAISENVNDATGAGTADGANVKGRVYVNWHKTDYKSHMEQDINMKSNIDRNTKTMFSDITRSQSMMQSFKSTEGAAQELSTTDLVRTANVFSTLESVDVKVELPPNTMLYIRQLMFDCDGNLVKMPFIYYWDGVSKLNLNDNNDGPSLFKADTEWNKTLGEDNGQL